MVSGYTFFGDGYSGLDVGSCLCQTLFMFDDIDITPQKQPKKPRDLSGFSVDDLNNYIAALTDEIARAENERTRKKAYLEGAASLFKKT